MSTSSWSAAGGRARPRPRRRQGGGDRVAIVEAVAGRATAHPDVRVLDGAAAIGWYDGVVTAIDDETLWSIRAGSVIAATGSYERVPSVRGADRPGVMGARLALALIGEHRVLPGSDRSSSARRQISRGSGRRLRTPAFARSGWSRLPRCGGCSAAAGLGAIVEVDGRRRRQADVVVFGDRTPNLDLPWQPAPRSSCAAASWRRSSTTPGGRPCPGCRSWAWRRGVGRTTPGVHADRSDLVCFCEDVHADEIHAQVAAGYGDSELVKRRTGALTGPCQGKYCLQSFCSAMAANGARPGGSPRPVPRCARPASATSSRATMTA